MFDIGGFELLLLAVLAVVLLGPKDLPKAMRFLGRLTRKAAQWRRRIESGMDDILRDDEIEAYRAKANARGMSLPADAPPDKPGSPE